MKTLISIDPGFSTGLICGTYSDTEPFKLTHFFQIEGGVEGFIKNFKVREHYSRIEDLYSKYVSLPGSGMETVNVDREKYVRCEHPMYPECPYDDHLCDGDTVIESNAIVIAEKFTARGGANSGFAYKTRDLEPLRIEGAMLAMGLEPIWTSPAQQYFSGGEGKAKKKQAQHRWLKEKGLYVTGKMVGCDNADDVRSAIAHAIAYLRKWHRPTQEFYFSDKLKE